MTKVCLKCGNQIEDPNIQFCPECGNQIGAPINTRYDSGLLTAAKVLMILTCVGLGWLLIPLAWLIPFTVIIGKRQTSGKKLSTGFKVCVLLFGNLIAGILLLCDKDA